MNHQPRADFGRIPITAVGPVLDGGLYPVIVVTGEDLHLEATVFAEDRYRLGVDAVLFGPHGAEPQRTGMSSGKPGSDSWHGRVRPKESGPWEFCIEAWVDSHATWAHEATLKVDAGIDTEPMLVEGAELFALAAAEPGRDPADREALLHVARRLGDHRLNPIERLAAGTSAAVEDAFARMPVRGPVSTSPRFPIRVERRAAGYGAWYEFFPRSEGASFDASGRIHASGTFRTAARRLDAVAQMGFDVVLLPPIHPIGRSHRNGPNNSPVAGPHDPGSPWAVGSADGGHDALNPELGGEADFAYFVRTAGELGLEVALDFSLQTSPDHPWVTEHPEWFSARADGSIIPSQEPPKSHPGIYQLNFENAPEPILDEVQRVLRSWIRRGVGIFRVDGALKRPLWFWQQLIGRVVAEHPHVVFMADATGSPAVLQALGKAGFQQASGNFSSWNTKSELEANLALAASGLSCSIRQNFFVSTPHMLSGYLQSGGRAGAKVRAVLAAMGSPLWGMYAGYELYEDVARPGSHEHLDSEKYEYKPRDFASALSFDRSLAPYVSRLNEIRRAHPALSRQHGLTIHQSGNDAVMVFSKSHPAQGGEPADTVIVVVNLDPHNMAESTVRLDLRALGMESDDPEAHRSFVVRDLLSQQQMHWGAHNHVRLDPVKEPALILNVSSGGATNHG